MAFKIVILTAFVACASAGLLPSAPVAYSAGPALHAAPVAYEAAPVAYKSYAAAPVAAYHEAAPIAYKSYAAAPVAAYHEAAPVAYAAPVAKAVIAKTVDDQYDPNPQYSYSYDVHDSLTGDAKSQHEERDGDVVRGSYSLLEADGTRRVVEYTADDHNGFDAVVHKEPAQVAVKAIAAAPVAAVHHAPAVATYAAPAVAYKSYAAPAVAAYAAPSVAYKSHHGDFY